MDNVFCSLYICVFLPCLLIGMPQSLVDNSTSRSCHYSLLFHKNCLVDYPYPYNIETALIYERRTWRTILQNGTVEEHQYLEQSINYLRHSYWSTGGTLFQKILLFITFHESSHFAQRLLSIRTSFGRH